MIQLTIYRDLEGNSIGIKLQGHAGYADAGFDIVCSAVSALSINLVNSIEKFTEDIFELDIKNGYIYLLLRGDISSSSKLLLNSCILGLQEIKKQYGNKYINIKFQEVK